MLVSRVQVMHAQVRNADIEFGAYCVEGLHGFTFY
jgi:hypothetical protein